jgi:hypothetical protein
MIACCPRNGCALRGGHPRPHRPVIPSLPPLPLLPPPLPPQTVCSSSGLYRGFLLIQFCLYAFVIALTTLIQ